MLAARRALGLSAQLHTEDRRALEQVILPEYARRTDIARILFVGCAAYTQRYGALFGAREYWTIDPVARRSRYGSPHHIVDQLQNLGRHVRPAYFDLIVCNGVLGWGLNTPADAEIAFARVPGATARGRRIDAGMERHRAAQPRSAGRHRRATRRSSGSSSDRPGQRVG